MTEVAPLPPNLDAKSGEYPKAVRVSSLCEVGIREINEDAVYIDETRKLFAVFDGVSSLDGYEDSQGKTGGYIASHTGVEVFRSSHGEGLKALFIAANNEVERLHEEAGIDTSDPIHRFGTTAAVVQIHPNSVELLQCADSIVLVINNEGKARVPLGYHDQDLPAMLEWQRLIQSGIAPAEVHARVRPMTIEKRREVNKTFGTLNGDPRAEKFALHAVIPIENIKHILLLTDGMYLPKEDPAAEEDWQRYADIFLESGLRGLFDTVRSLENSDPDLTRYPRYKLHDDASGIALSL